MDRLLSPRFVDALAYAIDAHGGQRRKGTDIPYTAHLLAVSALVLEYGGDEDLAIAALLHDVVEDCGAEHQGPIGARWGQRVLSVVLACSDSVESAAKDAKAPWRERKERYLLRLPEASDDALLVSCCDKIHNASSVLRDHHEHGPSLWSRFSGRRDGTLWYYRALSRCYDARGSAPAKHFARIVDALEQRVAQTEGWSAEDASATL